MCGIAGFAGHPYSEERLRSMTDVLSHRGPDAGGYFLAPSGRLGLGHRRLSILDLSEASNQPFRSQDGRYMMVFNGEVYNFQELIQKHQLQPKTSGDTEVVLECFAKLGPQCLKEFNGMFAFAIWDTVEEKLLIARDRMGIKPLFYHWDGSQLAFSSELKSITNLLSLETCREAIADFLYVGYIPQPRTIYKKTFKLPPGHYMMWSAQKGLQIDAFWDLKAELKPQANQFYSVKEAKAALNEQIRESVRLRMIADVPLGTFLSGGTDSSTVTAVAQSLSDRPVKTFSIGFKEGKFNEAQFAKSVANHLKTDHHEFILSTDDALEQFVKITSIYDEPFADSSMIPTLLVSEMARKHVTVALSGDGGDELFLGYGMYNWANRLAKPHIKSLRRLLAAGLELTGQNRLKRAATVFKYPSESTKKSHIFSQDQYLFSARELQKMLTFGWTTNELALQETTPSSRALLPDEAQAFFDMNYYLPDDLLVKVDRASMHHSLEVRVPLLDHNVVQFALNLPHQFCVREGNMKFLLKEVLYDYVPRKLFDRPKWGFSIPLVQWLKRELRYLIEESLSEETVRNANFVAWPAVERLVKRYFGGEDYLYNRVWALIVLHQWYLKNIK